MAHLPKLLQEDTGLGPAEGQRREGRAVGLPLPWFYWERLVLAGPQLKAGRPPGDHRFFRKHTELNAFYFTLITK